MREDEETRRRGAADRPTEFHEAVQEVKEMLESLSDQLLEDLLVLVRGLAAEPLDERKYSRSWREIIAFLDNDASVRLGSVVTYAVVNPEDSSLRKVSDERIQNWIDRAHRVAGRAFAVARQAQFDGVLDWDAAKVKVVEVADEVSTSRRIGVRVDRIDGAQLYLEMPPVSAVRLLRNYARDLAEVMTSTLAQEIEEEDFTGLVEAGKRLVDLLCRVRADAVGAQTTPKDSAP